MRGIIAFLLSLIFFIAPVHAASNRVYIANDDHTDYMWTANEATYRSAFVQMIDYYLDAANSTASNASPYQSRFNLDGSMWLWFYQKDKPARFTELMNRIKDGHISAVLNGLVSVYGGQSVESVIRGMYYPGKLERQYNIQIPTVLAMENATLPYGLGALWAGSGAKYTWKGVCCSLVPNLEDRQHEMYWWVGPDNSRILTKWYSFLGGNQGIGGYAEARRPGESVDFVLNDPTFIAKHPYKVKGVFGKGWDDLKTLTNEFITTAQQKTNQYQDTQVYVSNETDFFVDFENTYGSSLPSLGVSYGNEWDLFTGQIQELSSKVKRAVERLRTAEAMASLISLSNPSFMNAFAATRDEAYLNLGLFWEHCGTAGNVVGDSARLTWIKKMATTFITYSDKLYNDSLAAFSASIIKTGTNTKFVAFNPLGWIRTDFADFSYTGSAAIQVVDTQTNTQTPFQIITKNGQQFLRILATNIPSIGYKVFEIKNGTGTIFPQTVTTSGGIIENAQYKVTVASRGAITSLIDKNRSNREFVKTINGLALNDLSSTGNGTLSVENVGPVSATILASSTTPLAKTTRITLYNTINRIDIQNDINQNFNTTYTWSYGYNLTNPDTKHEEVGAVIRAKLASNGGHYANKNALYGWLSLNHFVDSTGSENVGITLSNWDLDYFKLGNSTDFSLDTTTPQIKALAGGDVGSGYPATGQAGETHFLQRFALATHDQYAQTNAMKMALEHQNPFVTAAISNGTLYPETSYSLVQISDPDTLLWAIKPHEDGIGSGLVMRLWNQSATTKNPTIQFTNRTIAQAYSITHLENDIQQLAPSGFSLTNSINTQQIKSYRFITNASSTTPIPTSTPTQKAGDANGDGNVNWEDLVIWIAHYNQTNGGIQNGNFNGDSIIDGRDYSIWASNVGN